MTSLRTLLVSVTLALTLAPAGGTYAADQKDAGLAREDRTFVDNALVDGATEIELGRLAQEKSLKGAIKLFGKRMADDHTKAREELKAIIARMEHTPKNSGADRKVIRKLSETSGAGFDQAYASLMVTNHEKAVKLFRRQADKGRNAELQQFAQRTVPTLRDHLGMARELKVQINPDGKKK